MAKVECKNCGEICDEYWMVPYFTGTGTQYLCWECYKQSQRENHFNEIRRSKVLSRTEQQKKRNFKR